MMLVAAAIAAVVITFVGTMRWELPVEAVRDRLEKALVRDTGYRIVSLGGAAFTALPWPVLQVNRLELANGTAANETASVPLAKARLNLFSWLTDDPRITALTLFEPKVSLRAANRPEETEAVAALIGNYLRQGHRPSLSYLRVHAGEATLDQVAWLSNLSFSVSNIASSDLMLTSNGVYRSQPFRLQVEVAPAGRASVRPLTWDFDLGDMSATFRGVLVAAPSLDADGRFSIALGAGTLRSRPLGLSRETAALLDGLTIEGEGRMSLPQFQFRTVNIERGDVRLTGAIDLVLSATAPRVAATLHARSIEVDWPQAEAIWAFAMQGLRDHAASRSTLRNLNADLRVSADRMTIAGLRMEDVASSAKVSPARIEASLSEGRIGSGVAKARVVLTESAGKFDARVAAQVQQVDVVSALGPGSSPIASGLATGQLSLEMSGRTADDLMASASGRGRLSVRNGTVRGVDVQRLFLRGYEVANPGQPDERTPFSSLESSWTVANGMAALTETAMRAPLWSARLEGQIDLTRKMLDLVARLSPAVAGGGSGDRAIGIRGPVAAPEVRTLQGQPGRS